MTAADLDSSANVKEPARVRPWVRRVGEQAEPENDTEAQLSSGKRSTSVYRAKWSPVGPTRKPGDPPPAKMKMNVRTKRNKPYTARRTLKRFNRVTRAGRLALRAYHEAAHAVLFELFGWPVHKISLVKRGDSNARTTAPIDIADEDEFEKWVDGGDEQDALWQTHAYILALLAGRVAEAICLGESFDAARFERDTMWHRGKPLSFQRLSRGAWSEHNDRDKAHLMTLRLRRHRRRLVKSVSDHLRASWDLTARILADVWPSVVRVGEALLNAEPPNSQGRSS